jgi:hypothetical protein
MVDRMRTLPPTHSDDCFLPPRPLQGGESWGEGGSASICQTLTPTLSRFQARERGNEQEG